MKKSWKKASAIFMAAALAAGLAGCGASNNNNTATTAAGKSAAESKVNGENSPEADNKKTDVTVMLQTPTTPVCMWLWTKAIMRKLDLM